MKTEGKKYDNEKPPMDLLSSIAMEEIAKVMGFGAKKYDKHNWKAGIAWSRVIAAALRHIMAFNSGQDKDPETGYSHLAHAGCCIQFLLEYEQTRKEFDDRYKSDAPKIFINQSSGVNLNNGIIYYRGSVTPKPDCNHKFWAPTDENWARCTECNAEINRSKKDSCI